MLKSVLKFCGRTIVYTCCGLTAFDVIGHPAVVTGWFFCCVRIPFLATSCLIAIAPFNAQSTMIPVDFVLQKSAIFDNRLKTMERTKVFPFNLIVSEKRLF